MSQFSQGLRFYLADPLARDIKILAYFFQRSFMTPIVQTKTQTNYSLLAWTQRLQHVAGDLLMFQSMQRGSNAVEPLQQDYEFWQTEHFNEEVYEVTVKHGCSPKHVAVVGA